jgi:dolichol-phosphate mannosyltransferase
LPETLDIVCAVYNDESCIRHTVDAIAEAVEPLDVSWRIVLVNDGSHDGSWGVLCALAEERGNITVLDLSRNFGQHIAVSAGLDFANGDYVVVIDSDLQEPPAIIPQLLQRLREEELDIVYACRRDRHDPALKRLTSWLFWGAIRVLAGPEITPHQMMLRGMRRRYVRAFRSLREQQRFVGGLSAWLGFRQGIIEVEGAEGLRGRSNYNLRRLVQLAVDATTSLSVIPLRFATALGFAVTGAAGLYGLYTLIKMYYLGGLLAGFPTLVLLISGFAGIQLTILGILGEYLGRVLRESQLRPLYFVRDLRGHGSDSLGDSLPLPPGGRPRSGG